MLQVEQVYKEYRKTPVLQDITFALPATGVASLVGPNGSGKTTLLNCISGLLAVSSGSIQINGKAIHSQEDAFGLVSYFFDDRVLLPDLSGGEHLLLLDAAQRQRADRYIRLFGAEAFLKKKVRKYSLGMKQILLIILTLSVDAPILIFDEALNGLDPRNRQLMMNEISSLKREKLILFSSHILHDVVELSDQILFLNRGTTEVFANDRELDLAALYMEKVMG